MEACREGGGRSDGGRDGEGEDRGREVQVCTGK